MKFSKKIKKIFLNKWLLLSFVLVIFGYARYSALGTSLLPDTVTAGGIVTDGVVNAVAVSGDTEYIGGSFTYEGNLTGNMAIINTTTHQLETAPFVDNLVYDSVPDGSGGWYIAGLFDKVGGLDRAGIAHINSDGTVDANFNANVNIDNANAVEKIIKVGNVLFFSAGYFEGSFTAVGGQSRSGIAAVNATTGAVLAWHPTITGFDFNSFYLDGNTLYLGGEYSQINDGFGGALVNRRNLSAWDVTDPTNPVLLPFHPLLGGGSSFSEVDSMLKVGNILYVGGKFDSVKGTVWNSSLASVDLSDATGSTIPAWHPVVDGFVYALKNNGNTLYAGGSMTTAQSLDRECAVAYDISQSSATILPYAIDARICGSGKVHSIQIINSKVFMLGGFLRVGNNESQTIDITDPTTGTADTSWDVGSNENIFTSSLSGSNLLLGGAFDSAGGRNIYNIAKIDLTTNTISSWNPLPDSSVSVIAVSGNTVYIGGSFSNLGVSPRNGLGAVDATTGSPTSWDPLVNGFGANGIKSMLINNGFLYIGGSFCPSSSTDFEYCNLNRYNLSDGSMDRSWAVGADSNTYTMVASPDHQTLYVGGNFASMGNDTRHGLAALDTTTGLATSWDPNITSFGTCGTKSVHALILRGSTMYVGGCFGDIGGQTRSNLASLDTTTALATSWNPGPSNQINALASDGTNLYAAGTSFDSAYDISGATPVLTSWNPNITSGWHFGASTVNIMTLYGSALYVGGDFGQAGTDTHVPLNWDANFYPGHEQAYFAQFGTYSAATTPTVSLTTTSGSGAETTSSVNIPLTLSASTGSDVTVDYAVTGGTAASGVNFTLPAGTATITSGNTTVNIPLTVIHDNTHTGDLTIIITISNPTNATLGANTTYTYTINDADAASSAGGGGSTSNSSSGSSHHDISNLLTLPQVSPINTPINNVLNSSSSVSSNTLPPVLAVNTAQSSGPGSPVSPAKVEQNVSDGSKSSGKSTDSNLTNVTPNTPIASVDNKSDSAISGINSSKNSTSSLLSSLSAVRNKISLAMLQFETILTLLILPIVASFRIVPLLEVVFKDVNNFYDLYSVAVRTVYQVLSFLGLRKKRKYWGTVYDSETKQPIDPAIVELVDAETGKVLEQCITDLAGRFGFLARRGKFRLNSGKTHYTFPSKNISSDSDQIYENVYHGEVIVINDVSEVVAPNIPMDPAGFDWNQKAKLSYVRFHPGWENFTRKFFKTIFALSIGISLLYAVSTPNAYNFKMLFVNLLMLALSYMFANLRLWGRVFDKSGSPLGSIILELQVPSLKGVNFGKALTAPDGKFFLKGNPGKYQLLGSKDVNGQKIQFSSTSVEIKKDGVVNSDIVL